MLKKVVQYANRVLNFCIALCLSFMALLVFGNVVLRYAFNSGITWSEEMSRFLFVWLVFLGAIAALKDKMHLGMDLVTNLLPPRLKKVVYVIQNLLVLYVLWLIMTGSLKMSILNMESLAPATKLPMGFVYGIGVVTSVAMGLIVIANVIAVLRNKKTTDSAEGSRNQASDALPDQSGKVQNG
ncbi:TRAP transporter small permease [Brevibacillus fulvus]|uniref:TRAP-type C4-dicarboxylate transport system permease small subunit n=1 Tax=Brevibacillus fulvus TaxID=1125967 RepID=A0A939BUI7_9BACL|nr:TRAP transporter small permease [Brevibacillus fulvus]MBM7589606.1 TRAP-type C4-dicarboxylate transport system permease small subunit [Brevibacillus fulvus]